MLQEVSSARKMKVDPFKRILAIGETGSGKSSQIWTLPGRKFAYVFEQNSMPALHNCPDLDYVAFLPETGEMDLSLKGFNKGSKSDKPRKRFEPMVYQRWGDDWNERDEMGFFANYDWLIFDSVTALSNAIMARQLYINGRYGDIEEQADYRITGSKVAHIFTTVSSMPINVYATGHLNVYQDDKTKRISTELWLPGQGRKVLPMMFTDIWLATVEEVDGELRHIVRTKPEPRGLKGIRCTVSDLEVEEDVTIEDYSRATSYGIGALLSRGDTMEKKNAKDQVRTR